MKRRFSFNCYTASRRTGATRAWRRPSPSATQGCCTLRCLGRAWKSSSMTQKTGERKQWSPVSSFSASDPLCEASEYDRICVQMHSAVRICHRAFLVPGLEQTQRHSAFSVYLHHQNRAEYPPGWLSEIWHYFSKTILVSSQLRLQRAAYLFRVWKLDSSKSVGFFYFMFSGDAWNIKQLRAKSSQDLHKLW